MAVAHDSLITHTERAGVCPKVAQTLARYSDIRLSLDVYAHVELYDQPELFTQPVAGRQVNRERQNGAKLDAGVQNFPLPSKSGFNRSSELLLTKSVPKYLPQMSMARRRPPSMRRRTSLPRKARSETPSGDAMDQPFPKGDDGLGQMHDQASGVFGHSSAHLEHAVAEAFEIPAAAQRVLQFIPQRIAQIEGQETQQERGLVLAELRAGQLHPNA